MADYYKIFRAIESEYGEEIALSAIQIATINRLQNTPEYYKEPNRTVSELARAVLWEMPETKFCLAFRIFICIYDWEVSQALHGLGGCTPKTFKELLSRKP